MKINFESTFIQADFQPHLIEKKKKIQFSCHPLAICGIFLYLCGILAMRNTNEQIIAP